MVAVVLAFLLGLGVGYLGCERYPLVDRLLRFGGVLAPLFSSPSAADHSSPPLKPAAQETWAREAFTSIFHNFVGSLLQRMRHG